MKKTHTLIYQEAKKYERADLELLRPLLLSVGLFLSLLVITIAFQVKQRTENEIVTLIANSNLVEEILEVPPTEVTPPQPSIQLPRVVEVPNEEEIVKEIDVTFDMEVNSDTRLQDIVVIESPVIDIEKENLDQIFLVVEESAKPKEGMNAFYAFVNENIKYPAQARRMNVEGKVFVEFVVSKDGTLTDINVVKGIGSGCDEEAMRIVQLSPPWQAAKQRGKAVRQRIVLPIFFMLYKG